MELLSEGLGNSIVQQKEHAVPVVSNRQNQRKFNPSLDTPIRKNQQASPLNDVIKREAGGNSMMESILHDTANTTLVSQLANGDTGTPLAGMKTSVVQQEQFTGSPEQVFGEDVSSRWASLAFMETNNVKKTA